MVYIIFINTFFVHSYVIICNAITNDNLAYTHLWGMKKYIIMYDPDPLHLAGSRSTEGNVNQDHGSNFKAIIFFFKKAINS